jgi:hypothetical protein
MGISHPSAPWLEGPWARPCVRRRPRLPALSTPQRLLPAQIAHRHYTIHRADEMLEACQEGNVEQVGGQQAAAGRWLLPPEHMHQRPLAAPSGAGSARRHPTPAPAALPRPCLQVKTLLYHECPPDAADYDGRTGLMLAIANGQVEVARALLEAGANVRVRDNFGHSAMWEAVYVERANLIELLKQFGEPGSAAAGARRRRSQRH